MRKLNVLLAALAVGLAVLFASCNPTTGLDQLSADDVTTSWVNGTWEGTSVLEADGNKTVTDISWNCDNVITQTTTIAAFKLAATSGNLYANAFKTKVVYYTTTKDKDGNITSKTTVTLTKK